MVIPDEPGEAEKEYLKSAADEQVAITDQAEANKDDDQTVKSTDKKPAWKHGD